MFSDSFCHDLKEWKARNGLQSHQISMSCGRVYEVGVKFCRVVLFDWSPNIGFVWEFTDNKVILDLKSHIVYVVYCIMTHSAMGSYAMR